MINPSPHPSAKVLRDSENELEIRDSWWRELRDEVRSHARALGYTAVVGYAETTTIQSHVCICTAVGTAAVLASAGDGHADEAGHTLSAVAEGEETTVSMAPAADGGEGGMLDDKTCKGCAVVSLPADTLTSAAHGEMQLCRLCGVKRVPEVLLTTIEPPTDIPLIGTDAFLQARICRAWGRKVGGREDFAAAVGDALPFLEHELHRQLLNKMRVGGTNALFNLRVQVTLGDSFLTGVATATSVYIPAMPWAPKLIVTLPGDPSAERDAADSHLAALQACGPYRLLSFPKV